MTREEKQKAIDALKKSAPFIVMTQEKYDDYVQIRNKIIELLEQELCEDAISRRAVLEYIEASDVELGHSTENELVCQYIKELPPVTPQPKIGKWIDEGFYAEGHSEHAYRCSECDEHYIGYVGEFKYCSNCGAKMKQ